MLPDKISCPEQVISQFPALHRALPLVARGQAFPQAPQFWIVVTSTSQPSPLSPLQLNQPDRHSS